MTTEQPSGDGFGRAAIEMSKLFKAGPDVTSRRDLNATLVVVPIEFTRPSVDAKLLHYISEPDWLTQISPVSALQIFPAAAVKAGVMSGAAVVDCLIDAKGMLTSCRAVSEHPADLGFGVAAVTTAQALSVNLWTRDGLPTPDARIRFSLRLVDQAPQAATAVAPTSDASDAR